MIPDSIPPAHHNGVRAALNAAFGTAPVDLIAPISPGASGAQLFRVETCDRRYLLRVEGPPSPLRNPHQYASMRMAAEAGIAPRLLYADDAGGIAITDFIEERPLRDFPGGRSALVRALGELLRGLQSTPMFPFFVEYPDIVTRLFAHVRSTGLFADGLLDPHWNRLEQINQTYAAGLTTLVSAHNDPNPRNILFDGERLWLIDWESAYRNDPLVDVAILLDNIATSPELEGIFLRVWLGREPDEGLRDRLAIIRSLTRLYYAGVLFSAAATMPRSAADHDLSAPSVSDFYLAVREGRQRADVPEIIPMLGKMYLSSFLSGLPVPALDPAWWD